MDKYEYQVCTEQIKSLIAEKRFAEAMDLADTIDWRRVRSVSMLCTVSEIYKINKRYEDARDILLLAYERHPTGRDIIYALCELAIKTNDIVQAIECYKEFVAIAPSDPDSYVLLYKIYKAQDVSLEEQIDILEELKSKDYREKWGYELAYLYHLTGQETKCIAACDELVLWFGDGKYVKKALELKRQHTTLTPEQQAKYEGRSTGSIPSFNQPYEQSQFGNNPQMTGPMMSQYGEYIQQTGAITGQLPNDIQYNTGAMGVQNQFTAPMAADVNGAVYPGQLPDSNVYQTDQMAPLVDQYGNLIQTGQYGDFVQVNPVQYNSYGQPIQAAPSMNHLGMTQDIILNQNDGSFSTMDLQEALGNQVKEVMALNVDGTQPIVYENNQDMFKDVERDNTSPQLFEQKYADESNTQGIPEIKSGTAMVHTGVIDLSDADLPPVSNEPIEISDTTPVKEDVIVSVEKKSIEETTDILSKLQGVIPGSVPVSKESTEVERIPGTTAAAGTGTVKGISAIQDLPEDMPVTGANGSVVNIPKTKSSVTGSIPAFLPSQKDINSDESVNEAANKEPINEEIDENVNTAAETAVDEEKIAEEKAVVDEDITPVIPKEVTADEASEEAAEQVPSERPAPKYPYDTVVDIGYVEELPELDQAEDVENMYESDDTDEEDNSATEETEEEAKKAYETDVLPEIDEFDNFEEDPDTDGNIYTRMKKDVKANREFDDDEFRIFCKYDGIESLKAQLVDAMDLMSMEGYHGNVIVMGSDNVDRKDIAINIVKVLKEKSNIFSGKVAKISGEALNKKNIKSTLSKLENGALIVESAGGLTAESIILITGTLKDDNPSVLVVLEDTKENIKPLFKATKQIRTTFDARVDISDFTNNDLVAYGRGYALEKEYTIDEFGTLALSSKLGELQTYDHKVTTDEVKEIIDMAIKHADKKNVGNFMDVLLGKKYDDDDFIILKEKDFNF